MHSATFFIDASTGVLNAVTFSKYIRTVSTVLLKTETLTGPDGVETQDIARAVENVGDQLGKKLDIVYETTSTSTNLDYQRNFPSLVHAFVAQEIRLVQGEKHGADEAGTVEEAHGVTEVMHKHLFFVFHPATDWHKDLRLLIEKSPLPGFIGPCDNLLALERYLYDIRRALGPEPVLHILLPTAHSYTLPHEIVVTEFLRPLKVKGEIHRHGQPYVSATITGLGDTDVEGIHLLPRPDMAGDERGGFSSTSINIHLKPPAVLGATCKSYPSSGSKLVPSELDLDEILGVEDGHFCIGKTGFSKRATNIRLETSDGPTLHASLSQANGPLKEAAIHLDAFVTNRGGRLMRYGELSGIQEAGTGIAGTVAGVAGAAAGTAICRTISWGNSGRWYPGRRRRTCGQSTPKAVSQG